MRKLVLTLWLPIGILISCKSSGNSKGLASFNPIELSYSSLARNEIYSAKDYYLIELAHYLSDDENSNEGLVSALLGWEASLSFFAHVFPKIDKRDPYIDLLESASFGLFLLREGKRGIHQLNWAKAAYADLTTTDTRSYLDSLNDRYATRRKIQDMPRAYWFGVNFIPDITDSFSSNFKDYLKAQRKALGSDIARAENGDPLFPGQDILLQNVRDRAEVLLRLKNKYLAVEEDSHGGEGELEEIHRFYSSMLNQLERYSYYRDNKDEARASILGKQIQKDWDAEKVKALSTSKS